MRLFTCFMSSWHMTYSHLGISLALLSFDDLYFTWTNFNFAITTSFYYEKYIPCTIRNFAYATEFLIGHEKSISTHIGKLIIYFPVKFQINLLESKYVIWELARCRISGLMWYYGTLQVLKLRLNFPIDLSEIWPGSRYSMLRNKGGKELVSPEHVLRILFFTITGTEMPHSHFWTGSESGTFGHGMVKKGQSFAYTIFFAYSMDFH